MGLKFVSQKEKGEIIGQNHIWKEAAIFLKLMKHQVW